MSLGDNIRYLRLQHNYSQEYLSETLGYKSYTTIQKWESGVSEPPVKKLKELATIFNVDMDDLANKDFTNVSPDNLVSDYNTGAPYYINIETRKVAQEIYENDRVLFDVYRSADKDRLIEYAKKLKALRDLENKED